MRSMQARVAERGQVTIPKPLRDRLGIRPGTVLEFKAEHGRLVAIRTTKVDGVTKAIGCLGKNIDTDALIDELRGRR